MTFCCSLGRWAPGALKNRLADIRSMHVSAGYGNPLELLERVYFVLDGCKRAYAHKPRRYPVRPDHLLWIREWLEPERDRNDAAIWLALVPLFQQAKLSISLHYSCVFESGFCQDPDASSPLVYVFSLWQTCRAMNQKLPLPPPRGGAFHRQSMPPLQERWWCMLEKGVPAPRVEAHL